MTHDLWPPLSVIRHALETTGAAAMPDAGPEGTPATATVAMPGSPPGTTACSPRVSMA